MSHKLLSKRYALGVLYAAVFFFSFHGYLLVYMQSGFINQFVAQRWILLLYCSGAILTLLALLSITKILKAISSHRLVLWLIVIEIVLCSVLATTVNPTLVIAAFIAQLFVLPLIGFNLDLFIEHNSTDKKTGLIRGLTYAVGGIPLIVAPALAGLLSANYGFGSVFYAANLIAIPLWIVLLFLKRHEREPRYASVSTIAAIKEFSHNKNVANVWAVNFMLQIFYSWMVIYTPLHLLRIGFDWNDIGFIFSIMLLPFLFFQLPLGWIADRKLGEKKIMVAGTIIMALSTAALALISSNNLWLWAAALFLTRVGASFVEIMTEVYFFKQIQASEAHILALYRMTRPLSFMIGPLIATITILAIGAQNGFLVLGGLMIVATLCAARLKG